MTPCIEATPLVRHEERREEDDEKHFRPYEGKKVAKELHVLRV